jgi:hypothetical protein
LARTHASFFDHRGPKLTRKLLSRPNDADAVVGKLVMRAGQFKLGHMTVRASLLGNFAQAGFRLGGVTCQATRVIVLGNRVHFNMRIVARGAADARVIFIEALACLQAIGLKPQSRNVANSSERDFFPCSMTLAAKVRDPSSAESRKTLHGNSAIFTAQLLT